MSRSESAAAAWAARYVRGACELDEMEPGVARALSGETSDQEWVALSQDRRAYDRALPSLETVDAILKAAYRGPFVEPIR